MTISRKTWKFICTTLGLGLLALSGFLLIHDPDTSSGSTVPPGTILASISPAGQSLKGTYTLVSSAEVLDGNRGIQMMRPQSGSAGAITYNFNPGPAWILSLVDKGRGDIMYVSFYHYLSQIGWGNHIFSGYRVEFRRDWNKVVLSYANQTLISADDNVDENSPVRLSISFNHGTVHVYRASNLILQYKDTNFDVHASPKDPQTFFEIGAINQDSSDTRIVSNIMLKTL